MRNKLLHAVLSGAIIAFTLGLFLIPTTWQMISQEPTFAQTNTSMETVGIVASIAIIAITLFSFKLVRRIED